MPLTELAIKHLKPKDKLYRVTDSNGLCLEVSPTGSKLWRYRFYHPAIYRHDNSWVRYTPQGPTLPARIKPIDSASIIRLMRLNDFLRFLPSQPVLRLILKCYSQLEVKTSERVISIFFAYLYG